MHNRAILLFISLFALLSGCVVQADTQKSELDDELLFADADAPADSRTRRLEIHGELSYDTPTDGHFSRFGYTAYLFTAKADQQFNVSVQTGYDLDPVAYLYGPLAARSWDGARPVAVDDDGGVGRDSYISYRMPAEGTYLLVVRDAWNRNGDFIAYLSCGEGVEGSIHSHYACLGGTGSPVCDADHECPLGSTSEPMDCGGEACPSIRAPSLR